MFLDLSIYYNIEPMWLVLNTSNLFVEYFGILINRVFRRYFAFCRYELKGQSIHGASCKKPLPQKGEVF